MNEKLTYQHRKDIEKALDRIDLELDKDSKLTYECLSDIEQELLHLMFPEKTEISPILCYDGVDNIVVSNVTWVKNNEIQSVTGIAKKRKGDVFNYKVGQILSLIDVVFQIFHTNVESSERKSREFQMRWT